jgi:hypothetical protein
MVIILFNFLRLTANRQFEDLGDAVLPENLAYFVQIFGNL